MSNTVEALNIWTGLLFAAAIQGLFLGSLFWLSPRNRQSKGLLAALMFVFSLTLFDYLGFWTKWHFQHPVYAGQYLWLSFLVGPLFYLFLSKVLRGTPLLPRHALHALPALAVIILHWPFYGAEPALRLEMLRGEIPYSEQWLLPRTWIQNRIIPALTITHLTAYGWRAYRLIPKKNGIQLRFSRVMVWLYGGFTAAYLFYYLIAGTPLFSLLLDYSISLAMVIFIYTIGWLGHRQQLIFECGELRAAIQPAKYQNSALTTSSRSSLIRHLEQFMEEEQPYLEAELRLPQLAERLNCSTHHLSQAINEQYGQTFSSYINYHRVQEARRLLQTPEWAGRAIIDIAYTAGFNNKTTFYKAFKEVTEQLPSQFRKEQAQKMRQHL